MKQPKLPGTEKFKFSAPDKPLPTGSSSINRLSTWSSTDQPSGQPSHHFAFHSRASSVSCPGELRPISSTLSVPLLSRSDSRRRAVLPITCSKTSRMLSNTNAELNVNIAPEDDVKTNRVPSCPNLETSSRSLAASKTSLDAYMRKMSLQNSAIRELPPDFDWKNIRAAPSRLSASCSSCCSSEESVWVLREEDQ